MKKNSFELFQKRIESFLVNDYQYNGVPYYNIGFLEFKLSLMKADRIYQKVLLFLMMGSLLGVMFRFLIIAPYINQDRIFFSFVSMVIIFSILFLKHDCFSYIEWKSVSKYLKQLLDNNPELINEKVFIEKLKNIVLLNSNNAIASIDESFKNKIIELSIVRCKALKNIIQKVRIASYIYRGGIIEDVTDAKLCSLDMVK